MLSHWPFCGHCMYKELIWQQKYPQSKLEMVTGVNICPNKSETVYPEIWGILKLSGLINQKIFKTVHQIFKKYQTHKSTFFKQCWRILYKMGNIFVLSKNCLFYIFFDLKCGRTSAHIVCICLVQNCLSQVKISETVYSLSGFWNCLAWKGQTTGFLFTPGWWQTQLYLFLFSAGPHFNIDGCEHGGNFF